MGQCNILRGTADGNNVLKISTHTFHRSSVSLFNLGFILEIDESIIQKVLFFRFPEFFFPRE